jgi:enoyl-[acyl-carrier-protein] reductase (NADH)
VNGISAGPIKTLAASGIKDFGKLLSVVAAALAHAPQRDDRRRGQRRRLPAVATWPQA